MRAHEIKLWLLPRLQKDCPLDATVAEHIVRVFRLLESVDERQKDRFLEQNSFHDALFKEARTPWSMIEAWAVERARAKASRDTAPAPAAQSEAVP